MVKYRQISEDLWYQQCESVSADTFSVKYRYHQRYHKAELSVDAYHLTLSNYHIPFNSVSISHTTFN